VNRLTFNPANSGSFRPKTGADAKDTNHIPRLLYPFSVSTRLRYPCTCHVPRLPPNQENGLCNLLPLPSSSVVRPVPRPPFPLLSCMIPTVRGIEKLRLEVQKKVGIGVTRSHRRHRSSFMGYKHMTRETLSISLQYCITGKSSACDTGPRNIPTEPL
jgi:hypothetical protein